jgi:hypothetical protein
MKVKVLQKDEQYVAVVVHGDHDAIDSILKLIQDRKTGELPDCETCGGEGTYDEAIPCNCQLPNSTLFDLDCIKCYGKGYYTVTEACICTDGKVDPLTRYGITQ